MHKLFLKSVIIFWLSLLISVPALGAQKKRAVDLIINGHTHAAMVLFRGLADDKALMDWLQNYIFPAEEQFVEAEFVRIGTQLS